MTRLFHRIFISRGKRCVTWPRKFLGIKFRGTEVVFLVGILFSSGASCFGASDSHDTPPTTQGNSNPSAPKRAEQQRPGGEASSCGASPQNLADFANGDVYNFHSMVTFLTQPECADAAPELGRAAEAIGIKFSSSGPFKLQDYALSVPASDLDARLRVDAILSKNVSGWLRDSPLSTTEILPVMGQLAVLSPQAARISLVNLIEMQLYGADPGVLDPKSPEFNPVANSLARMLDKLGANEPVIAANLADSVEEMAFLAQADSLGKIFRGLATAATVDATLAPTFNLSADAFSRGIQKGKKFYSKENRDAMLLAVFRAVQASIGGSETLEAGAGELNEAIDALIKGKPLQLTNLKKLYKEALKVVADSPAQSAIADAIALSLTPDFVYLSTKDLAFLLRASRNYPQIASALQINFLLAWEGQWNRLQEGELKVTQFNRTKSKVFEPVLNELLELEPGTLDPLWLKAVLQKGLISDEQIEKKFPRFLLVYLEQREKAARTSLEDVGLNSMVISMTENFRILWTVSNIHIPALMKWVQRYDQ